MRWVVNAVRIMAIDARNAIRREAFEEAFAKPSAELSSRLKAARSLALGSIGNQNVAFSTSKLDESYDEYKARAWEEKLVNKK